MGNYKYDPEVYGFLDQHYGFLSASPIRGGYDYLSLPRRALGVNEGPFRTPPGTPLSHTDRHGAVKFRKLRVESGILRTLGRHFGFPHASRIRDGFFYFGFPRWALVGVNVHPSGTSRGTLRGGKIGKLRLESGILRVDGASSRFSFCAARDGLWAFMAAPSERPPEPDGIPRGGKWENCE